MELAELEEKVLQKKRKIFELRATLIEVWSGPQGKGTIAELREHLVANWTGSRASLFLDDPYTNVGVPSDQGPIMKGAREYIKLTRRITYPTDPKQAKELIREFVSTVDEVNLLIKQLPRTY